MNQTFANFIVGTSNQLACQAAVAVANSPAAAYNPLLIRAADGLGKTHLLRAVGHHFSQNKLSRQITYLTPDDLSHKLHNALQNNSIEALRKHYRKTDLLLADDLQDIAGKSYTQQTLLHILDDLLNTGKQIVMASTTMPQDITPLDARLRSRLTGGVSVEIQAPETETRLAILHQKAATYRISLSDSVASLIASDAQASIRELENNLARLAAYASLRDAPIDTKLVNDMLQPTCRTTQYQVSVVQQTVASHFGVKVSDIKAKKRDHNILIPRQIAMYLCQEVTDAPLAEIGRLFGGRSPATVQHAYAKIGRLTDDNAGIARAVHTLRKTLVVTGVEMADISFPQSPANRVCG